MAALRLSATLAHALPGVCVRIRDGEHTLLNVARPPFDPGPAMAPCAFRRVVAQAHEQQKVGLRLGFMGLPHGVDPAVDTGVRAGDAVLPGGIHRVRVGDVQVHAFATTLPARACRAVLCDGGWEDVRLHGDAATEVTLVHAVTPVDAGPPLGFDDLLARLVADELLHEVLGVRA